MSTRDELGYRIAGETGLNHKESARIASELIAEGWRKKPDRHELWNVIDQYTVDGVTALNATDAILALMDRGRRMDEYEEATARLRVAWATHYTADFESGPGDYHYEHCDFSELDRLLAEHDRVVAAKAWDEGFTSGQVDMLRHEVSTPEDPCTPNPYRITEENN